MKQHEEQQQDSVGIQSAKDAAQWLLLAYSLGHPDECPCEHCLEARAIAFAPAANDDSTAVA